jgi:hypothetical protein
MKQMHTTTLPPAERHTLRHCVHNAQTKDRLLPAPRRGGLDLPEPQGWWDQHGFKDKMVCSIRSECETPKPRFAMQCLDDVLVKSVFEVAKINNKMTPNAVCLPVSILNEHPLIKDLQQFLLPLASILWMLYLDTTILWRWTF